MTTERLSLYRERAADLPIYAVENLPPELDRLTVEARRLIHEDLDGPVARASRLLVSALAAAGLVDRWAYWMLATDSPTTRSRRLAVLFARKHGLWGPLARGGLVLPAGARFDTEFDYPDSDLFGQGGTVELPVGELPAAVEVTRLRNAVCVVTEPGVDPAPVFFGGALELLDGRPPPLLTTALHGVVAGTFAMAIRGYGAFDDYRVGVDIFGYAELLDGLEAALREVLAG